MLLKTNEGRTFWKDSQLFFLPPPLFPREMGCNLSPFPQKDPEENATAGEEDPYFPQRKQTQKKNTCIYSFYTGTYLTASSKLWLALRSSLLLPPLLALLPRRRCCCCCCCRCCCCCCWRRLRRFLKCKKTMFLTFSNI